MAKNRKRELDDQDPDLSTFKKNHSYFPKPPTPVPESKPTLQLIKKSICKCGFALTEANFSKVRNKFFCPMCCQDYSKEELEKR